MGTAITQIVWDYLARDLSMQKNLQRGILNIRALSKHIIKEQNLKSSIDAVISAIRRFSNDKKFQKESANVENIFKFSNIATRNNMSCMILRNQSDIQKYLSEAAKITDLDKGETLRLIKGRRNLKIITDNLHIEKLKNFFSNKEMEIKNNLSELRIKLSSKADQTKGVIARISNELVLRNINVSEIILCVPELIIYVDQKDLIGAYESIMKLCRTGN